MSSIRQNYDDACETAVNTTVNAQHYASYVFLSMSSYCDRHDVALPGLHKLLSEHSEKMKEDAEKLIKYQNERGGKLKLQEINKPTTDDWSEGSDLLNSAVMVYKSLNSAYIQLHDVADGKGDPHLGDFVEDHYLGPTVERIKKLGDMITQLRLCGKGLGEYLFDHELQS